MLSSVELLNRLRERKVKHADIARALNLKPSAVTRMFAGGRRISLDEGKKLVDTFKLEEPVWDAISEPVAMTLARHAARSLAVPENGPGVADLAYDLRAWSAFAAAPDRRDSVDQVEGFLTAMTLRREQR